MSPGAHNMSELLTTTNGKTTTLPKLNNDGSNWVRYRQLLLDNLHGQKGYRKHLMGREKRPVEPAALQAGATQAQKVVYEKEQEEYEEKMDAYLEKESAI